MIWKHKYESSHWPRYHSTSIKECLYRASNFFWAAPVTDPNGPEKNSPWPVWPSLPPHPPDPPDLLFTTPVSTTANNWSCQRHLPGQVKNYRYPMTASRDTFLSNYTNFPHLACFGALGLFQSPFGLFKGPRPATGPFFGPFGDSALSQDINGVHRPSSCPWEVPSWSWPTGSWRGPRPPWSRWAALGRWQCRLGQPEERKGWGRCFT